MKELLWIVAIMLIASIALCLAGMSIGCGPGLAIGDGIYQKTMDGKGCSPTKAVCEDNKLMLCNADHEWEVNTDCADFEPLRECCAINKISGCYKPEECEAE